LGSRLIVLAAAWVATRQRPLSAGIFFDDALCRVIGLAIRVACGDDARFLSHA